MEGKQFKQTLRYRNLRKESSHYFNAFIRVMEALLQDDFCPRLGSFRLSRKVFVAGHKS